MEKKYQVFVSSTYQDLIEERDEIMKALLELDCIPIGMELFPSANDEALAYIKKAIDNCDYFISIVAGIYGSVHSSGKSYSQLEYEYAHEKNIPTIAFLCKNPKELPAYKYELDAEKLQKLNNFRSLLETKLCRYWNTKGELSAIISRSIVKLIKDNPRNGWIRQEENIQINFHSLLFNQIQGSEKKLELLLQKLEIAKPKVIKVEELEYEKMEVDVVSLDKIFPDKEFYSISLGNPENKSVLPIVIGQFEAGMLVFAGTDQKIDRPFLHELTINLIKELGYHLTEVILHKLSNSIYYSKLVITDNYNYFEFDSRTSDAMILAILSKCPIYVNKSIFDDGAVADVKSLIEKYK